MLTHLIKYVLILRNENYYSIHISYYSATIC
jgi:hypothetical protein